MSTATLAKATALATIGSLSRPSKMPGSSWSISAKKCIVGSILHKKEGTICAGCYARKGNYTFPVVVNAHETRLNLFNKSLVQDGGEAWVDAMSFLISCEGNRFFRWFDSGDLQSYSMLDCIVRIAKKNKSVKFWLPTKEYGIVKEWVKLNGKFPVNLNVRLSAYKVGFPAPKRLAESLGCTTSEVTYDHNGGTCRAQTSGEGVCGPCRACWNKKVSTVTYIKH
jgi:hypothetical protein